MAVMRGLYPARIAREFRKRFALNAATDTKRPAEGQGERA